MFDSAQPVQGLSQVMVSIISTGAETKNVGLSETGSNESASEFTVSAPTTSMSDFGSVQVNSTSTAQSFTVSGSNLTANVALSAPAGFEISKISGSGYGSSLSLTQLGGTD